MLATGTMNSAPFQTDSASVSITSAEGLSDNDDITSIVIEAQRIAKSELHSTSEVLKFAGAVLRERYINGDGNVDGTKNGILNPHRYSSTFSVRTLSSGPHSKLSDEYPSTISVVASLDEGEIQGGSNCAIPEYSNLPGKYTTLSSDSIELFSGLSKNMLLSRIDGLTSCSTPRMGKNSINIEKTEDDSNSFGAESFLTSFETGRTKTASSSISSISEKLYVRSKVDIAAAMENVMAHANRIKGNQLKKYNSTRSTGAGYLGAARGDHSMTMVVEKPEIKLQPQASQCEMMPTWVSRKIAAESGVFLRGSPSVSDKRGSRSNSFNTNYFGQYEIHQSETIITHEIHRGDWTWVAEWSPDGQYLALATENHNFAIVEAGMSTLIWKVIHDERIGKLKNDTTHTIRSIAWGSTFIAIGGTGDAVSIVDPCLSTLSDDILRPGCATSATSKLSKGSNEHFSIVDVITETGFVGSLHWRKNSNILAIGNREDQCLIVDVSRNDENGTVNSKILQNIERSDWVNAVRFSPGGTKLAVGDRSGLLSVYLFVVVECGELPTLSALQEVELDDNILDIQWSPDAKYIYTGGEDYSITVIDTSNWNVLHKIGTDRWVPFMAPSRGGSHLAVGGRSTHVSLLDIRDKWREVTSLPVENGIPLSAKWHPNDQYLAITGQFEDVIVYETSCRRLLEGKCVRSKSTILAVEFSPNGKVIAVGNEAGLVTFFDLQSPSFVTLYETVIGNGSDVCIQWSSNGKNVGVTSGMTFVLYDTIYCGKEGVHPQSSSRFLVRKVIQNGINFTSLAFSPKGDFIALTDNQTRILNVKNDFSCIRVMEQSNVLSTCWSHDGSHFAMIGKRENLSIYNSRSSSKQWKLLFTISITEMVHSLCWGPTGKRGLQYLAFGGENKIVTVLEIRSHECTWENVLQIPFTSNINVLHWNASGLLAMGDDEGITTIVDLSYLKSGLAVNEMNYNWQRQGVISRMKLTRNFGRNAIISLCWLSSVNNGHTILATGGSDGIVEIIDLSARNKFEEA